ncbi:MAG TPA: class I SAM-dependent methyltransferase [Candidatus Sulfotelmatobacter sp.]|nr:class I SAM-dependent methyltransferase [Candidatus Sulfotelmatobacter sp.]
MDSTEQTSLVHAAHRYWRDIASRSGRIFATRALAAALWEFLRDSTPARLRQRYGDADYDWDHRVNTTSGAVGWRDRLLGVFHSAYQPTEPALFHEMLDGLAANSHLDFRDFTFLDLGSGKGRTLLMASDYPFRRILGVELLHALDRIVRDNLRQYKNDMQQCFALESLCADATTFLFPDEPLVIYLFNPFPETGMRQVVANLEQSLRASSRPVYVLYHNPLLEHVLTASTALRKIGGTHQYSVFRG